MILQLDRILFLVSQPLSILVKLRPRITTNLFALVSWLVRSCLCRTLSYIFLWRYLLVLLSNIFFSFIVVVFCIFLAVWCISRFNFMWNILFTVSIVTVGCFWVFFPFSLSSVLRFVVVFCNKQLIRQGFIGSIVQKHNSEEIGSAKLWGFQLLRSGPFYVLLQNNQTLSIFIS